eukprot:CAMPEP_0167792994 /NCGR_PEP_ID=MMETSP0111_2-20121227/12896_1 /TAXON_ID=91324 /ORGANISM="Lotharella globosa, Strain CCCM811" /LENGTH=96 /DNA_ID=CAMNT_0007686027 /DNA_START=388 /DNA_END=678 /DNA_ORIENTATION=+
MTPVRERTGCVTHVLDPDPSGYGRRQETLLVGHHPHRTQLKLKGDALERRVRIALQQSPDVEDFDLPLCRSNDEHIALYVQRKHLVTQANRNPWLA